MAELSINDIIIGTRHRKDFRDVKTLATSIEAIGLLQPIVITPDNKLIAGRRRIEAYKLLGRAKIPVRVLALDDIVLGERDENMERMDFTQSEMVAIIEAVEDREDEAAKSRQRKHGGTAPGKKSTSGNLPGVSDESRRATTRAAAVAGMKRKTFQRAKAVVEAARAEPERFGHLVEKMDRTGRVNGVFKLLKVARQAEAIEAEAPPLPKGPFRVIVADPPWEYWKRDGDPSCRVRTEYATMPTDDIKAYLPAGLAGDDCVLWLWTTNAHMLDAFAVADAWGFTQKTILTWVKHKMGTGDWLRGKSEHCLMCVKGKPTVTLTNQTTVLMADAGKHSAKPDEFYAMVDDLCPGSKVELFQRTLRDGYVGAGLEAE